MKAHITKQGPIPVKDANIILLLTFLFWLAYKYGLSQIPFIKDNILALNIVSKVVLVIPAAVFLFAKKINVPENLGIHRLSWFNVRMSICALLCCYPTVGVLNLISTYFVRNKVDEIMPELMKLGFVPCFLFVAVIPPLIEEMIYRGIIYRSYSQYSVIGGALLSGLCFGLMHLNLNQMPYAFFTGCIFALMDEATGSVLSSLLMHITMNGISTVSNFVSSKNGDRRGLADSLDFISSVMSPKLIIIAIAIIAVSLLLLFLIIRRTVRRNNHPLAAKKPAKASRLMDSYMITFLIASGILTIINTKYI